MTLLKFLHFPVGVSQSCSAISRHRVPVVFVRTRTQCSVTSPVVFSRHASAAFRLNGLHRAKAPDQSLIRQRGTVRWLNAASAPSEEIMNVFDRKTKRKQRNLTAHLPNYSVYDYLKDEV